MRINFTQIFGGNPITVGLRLMIISLIVGVILSALGLTPLTLIDGLFDIIGRIWAMGFDAIDHILGYLLIGAVIVVPVWLIMRVAAMGKN